MRNNAPALTTLSHQSSADKVRRDARRFVDGLAERLIELDKMSVAAKRYSVFNADEYASFKALFLHFTDRTEEFQLLSYLTEETLAGYERGAVKHWKEHQELEGYFRKLQVPMLRQVIATNLRLLKIWDDRLQRGEGLPYGAREVFMETIRVIYNAKTQLLRPRYVALLDASAMRDADRAERLLRTLVRKAPKLFNFADNPDDARVLAAADAYDDDDDYEEEEEDDVIEDGDPLIT